MSVVAISSSLSERLIGLGGFDLQQVAGKLVGVRDLRKQQKVCEILPEPIEISLDLLDILSEFENFCTRIRKFSQGNLSTSVSSGFRVLGEEN